MLGHFNLPEDVRGAVITRVEPGSVADAAGLQPGDVITQVQGVDVGSAKEAERELKKRDPDAGIRLRVLSSGGAHRCILLTPA